MFDTFPKIGVVIIGVNAQKFIPGCIESVLNSDYPENQMEIVYVDGGSSDQSIEIASNYPKIKILKLNSSHPTPGKGRNAGWKLLDAPYIQFLDADTMIDRDWFKNGLPHLLRTDIAAVCGHRRERYPDKNCFHMIGNMEWKYETGSCRYFGGDVLIKRNILVDTEGFDEALVAGEDPELSYRIRQKKLHILRIDHPMTLHDLNMVSFNQYLRRAYRSGYGYAEIAVRHCRENEKLWTRETIRVVCKAFAPLSIFIAGIATGNPATGVMASLLILLLPLLKISKFKTQFSQTWGKSFLYSIHICLVVFPQFAGVMRYLLGVWTQLPLKNNSTSLGSYLKAGA
jgi:glycosyltransferase involved in cell wall biosynthesis